MSQIGARMAEVKKTDYSVAVLASIESQVPTVVDKYLGTKLDDALLRILERHTADLIEKYSVLPGPESIKNQESERVQKEISKSKREQGEEINKSQLTPSGQTDKVKDNREKNDSDDDRRDDDDEGLQLDSNRSDASALQTIPALTSTGMADHSDTRDAGADSSMHRSDPEIRNNS
ncbi:hypothetical protein Tco_0090574 [Tanacetum coccineum]